MTREVRLSIFAQESSDGTALIILLLFFVVGAAFYFLPSIVALIKKAPSKISVIIINLFFGWTFVGWVVALAMAFRDPQPPQQVNVYNQPPPSPPESE